MEQPSVDPHATPVILTGAPRSGTTFLTTILNSHPQMMISNELRCWNVFNDLRRRTAAPSQALPEHPLRDRFRDSMLASMATLFRDFYRDDVTPGDLGCASSSGTSVSNVIKAFGDKNPGYSDSNQPGCLDFIAEAMPDAKFIHIYRDPRSCVASYQAIPVYSNELDRCIDIWMRHVKTVSDLRDRLGPDRVIEVCYERFVTEAGDGLFRLLEIHCGVDAAGEPLEVLARERAHPIPYRSPSTPQEKLGMTTFEERLPLDAIRQVEEVCGDYMSRYGYSPI